MMERALGDEGFRVFQQERGVADTYTLTAVQADAILRMTLGQLVNLEQQKLGGRARRAAARRLANTCESCRDDDNIRAIIQRRPAGDQTKYGDERRTEITGEEIGSVDLEDLITEETMVVSISHKGYIKRTPVERLSGPAPRRQGPERAPRPKKKIRSSICSSPARTPICCSSPIKGKVYWQKVYDLPELKRDSRGRAIVNLLNLAEGEKVAECLPIRDFTQGGAFPDHGHASGLMKKTPLEQYSRPKRVGIIAINLKEGDELVAATIANAGDEIIMSLVAGQAVRFRQATARASGPQCPGRPRHQAPQRRHAASAWSWPIPTPRCSPCAKKATASGRRFGPNSPAADSRPRTKRRTKSTRRSREAEASGEEDEGGDSSSSRYPTRAAARWAFATSRRPIATARSWHRGRPRQPTSCC